MKERFIITTYDPNIVGGDEIAYYIGGGNFSSNKISAHLFDEYMDAMDMISIIEIDYAQIEKVFIF